MTAKATVLVSVSPRMVKEALVRVLREAGFTHVRVRARTGDSFDGAVVIGELPSGVTAHVVLRLPEGRLGAAWRVQVTVDGRRRPARTVDGLQGFLMLLDEFVPSARRRSERFRELFERPPMRGSS